MISVSHYVELVQPYLIGAFVGAVAAVAIQYYLAYVPGGESRPVRLARHHQYVKEVSDAYETLVADIFSIQRASGIDVARLDRMRAIVALRGSPKTKELLEQFLSLPTESQITFDTAPLVDAIHSHIVDLYVDSP